MEGDQIYTVYSVIGIIVVVFAVLLIAGIRWMNGPSEVKTPRMTAQLAGWLLLIAGLAAVVYFVGFYSTAVNQVINDGLTNNRQIGVLCGIAGAFAGLLILLLKK